MTPHGRSPSSRGAVLSVLLRLYFKIIVVVVGVLVMVPLWLPFLPIVTVLLHVERALHRAIKSILLWGRREAERAQVDLQR